jgi:hypothetical protein
MEIAAFVLWTLVAFPAPPSPSDANVSNSVLARLTPAATASLYPAPSVRPADRGARLDVRRAAPRGRTLAIVGGALFVAGLLVDGDGGTILILAGAGIGAYGLYLMLGP